MSSKDNTTHQWQAQWIGLQSDVVDNGEHRTLPARYLRREFALTQAIKRATARVCGLGKYDFLVNGTPPDDRMFAPGFTYFTRRALYVSYDLTDLLQPGKNAVGITLGNGRFFAPRINEPTPTKDFGLPCLLFQLDIEYADGTKTCIVSDESWQVTDNGPTRDNNEYDGETYDARMEMPSWSEPHFDESAWKKADLLPAPTTRLDPHKGPPDRVTEILRPVAIENCGNGNWLVDFGQNFYGSMRCHVQGEAGHEIRWTAAYSLDEAGQLRTRDNRDALSCDRYILKGEGLETWNPRFRGQGMRRVLIENWPGKLIPESVEGLVIHADMAVTGAFTCSNPLFNQIYKNIRWGQRMYRREGVPMDPDRNERQGWLGDIAMNTEGDFYHCDARSFFEKWLVDIQLDQRENGCLPDTSPAVWNFYSDNIDWPAAYLLIISNLLRFYGAEETVALHYPNLERWLHYLKERIVLEDGTVDANIYTDWCDASTIGTTVHKSTTTSGPFISSAYWCLACRETARLGKRIGKDTSLFDTWSEQAQAGFLRRFVDPETGATPGDTQCELAILLGMQLAPDSLRETVAVKLNSAIRQAKNTPTVGLIGMQWLMYALDHPACEMAAFDLVANESRPGWGYMVRQGATTIWENWDSDSRDPGMNSEALLMLAASLSSWFHRCPAGILQAADSEAFERIILAPRTGSLQSVEAHYDSIRGRIASHWAIHEQTFEWNLQIPPGLPAEIRFPTNCQAPYLLNGEPTQAIATVPPGQHTLKASIPSLRM